MQATTNENEIVKEFHITIYDIDSQHWTFTEQSKAVRKKKVSWEWA